MDKRKLTEAMKNALRTFCNEDEHGIFYITPHTYHRNELNIDELRCIGQSHYPFMELENIVHNMFKDELDTCYCEAFNRVLMDRDVKEVVKSKNPSELHGLFDDCFYVKEPIDHFLKQGVCVDFLLDCTDIGACIGADNLNIPEEASLLWLAKQQGYTKTRLLGAFLRRGYDSAPFLESVYTVAQNCASSMNVATFLVNMELQQYFELHKAIIIEADRNRSVYLKDRTGRGYVVLDKNTTCGLFDFWKGGGGALGIKLEKDVKLPLRCLQAVRFDSYWQYSIRDTLQCGSGAWQNTLKEIHAMKK